MFEMSRRSLQRPLLAKLELGIVDNHPKTVKKCIDDGVDVNALTPKNGVRPLELALEMCNVSIMRLLLERGADIEGTNPHGSTTLIKACRYGYLECVELLVEHGANLYTLDVDGKTCLHAALERKHYSIVTYLLREDACEDVARPTIGLCLWQHLILTDDDVSMSKLRCNEFDLNDPCPDGTLLVFLAIHNFKNKALKGLLEAGADPNIQNAVGRFALCVAVEENNIDAARLLIEHGADCHLKDNGVWSPIRVAIFRCSLPMIRLLLDCGVDIEQDLGLIGTPLTLSCSIGCLEGAKLLVERGANLNACTVDKRTCLLLALEYKNHSIVDYLLDQDVCKVNETGRKGLSALHHAILSNNGDWMCKLLQKQADVNIQNREGEVPVFFATKHGKVELLHMLLEAGANPNIPTYDDAFPLHEAVRRRDVEAVKLLLHHGADKDRMDENKMKPVEVAEILFPPPRDIIHCLLAGCMVDQEHEVFHPNDQLAEDNKKIFDAEVEEALCCPITFEIMKDPVIASDGHTYEREAIEEWIREKKESPVTRMPLTSATLIPNLTVKHLIAGFAKLNRSP